MQIEQDYSIDLEKLAADLNSIHRDTLSHIGSDDFKHLQKMERWGRICTACGYGTAWIMPNPVSAWLISQGNFTRWALVTHPILHGAYDRIPGVPHRYTSGGFAKGWRRFFDWFDWIDPDGWHQEHDVLHHYNLGQASDPDQLQTNCTWLRHSGLPIWLRYVLIALFACVWKPVYYVRVTIEESLFLRAKRNGEPRPVISLADSLSLFTEAGRLLWYKSFIPYAGLRFVLIPLLFIPLGTMAVTSILINTLLAEIITNLHSFLAIIPNHAGDDVYRFKDKAKSRGEFYLRQILGSVNYPTGSNFRNFFYGWLNYQIEHHLWPNLPLSQYCRVQPLVEGVCKKNGIIYCQESVFKRLKKAVDVMVGKSDMRQTEKCSNKSGRRLINHHYEQSEKSNLTIVYREKMKRLPFWFSFDQGVKNDLFLVFYFRIVASYHQY